MLFTAVTLPDAAAWAHVEVPLPCKHLTQRMDCLSAQLLT